MKKIVLTLVFSFIVVSIYAQSNEKPLHLKYNVLSPNGSVALTIIDNSIDETMKLESADNFYKYQLLDTKTNEPVFSSLNKGKECVISKSKVAAGTYNLRLYTNKFIITSKITVSTSPLIATENYAVAMRD